MKRNYFVFSLTLAALLFYAAPGWAWHDETHVAIAKVAGYKKWFNAAAADIMKMKAGEIEYTNHFVNNNKGTLVDEKMVFKQVKYYNTAEEKGHLYGAIIASVRDYLEDKKKGKYGEYHLAFCAHYVGDLSQPLHNVVHGAFNKKMHTRTDNIINDEVLDNLPRINIYPIKIKSEKDLAREIARIANLSIAKGYAMEKEDRNLTKDEAYDCIGHSTSLFKAILEFVATRQ